MGANKLKYRILKCLDVIGLNVLEPVVRLVYRDEPHKQIKDIVQFILVPIFTFIIFVMIWGYVAPRHTTKSGEVPTPGVVINAANGIWRFHQMENQKETDYTINGEDRLAVLAAVEQELADTEKLYKSIDEKYTSHEQEVKTKTDSLIKPLQDELGQLKADHRQISRDYRNQLIAEAESIPPGDESLRNKFLDKIRSGQIEDEKRRNLENEIEQKIAGIRNQTSPELTKLSTERTRLAEKRQFLIKRSEQLTSNNRALKSESAKKELIEGQKALATAQGKDLYRAGIEIINAEERIERIESSEYAKPWTFPAQIIRSIKCVFLGFLIASAMAIPVGIMCGLNPVCMAALTPLISIFKPVSPIVWLPIVFIIVGGFIEDPNEAAVHPAFLSSAITVALCSLWPTLVNTAHGVSSINDDYINVARVLRLGFWKRLFRIIIPSAMPLIFTGLRISLGVGWMVLIAAELLSSSQGIGKFVWDMFNNGSSETFAQMFVVVFVVGLIGFLLDRIMIILQKAVSFEGAKMSL